VRSMSAWVGARWRSGGQTSGGQTINSALCDKGPQPGCTMLPRPPRPSSLAKHELARLRRACRIALLEAGGGASLDEIRILIVRRGSFAFMESGPSDSVILQTLIRMRARGEVRCLENDPQKVWERITPPEEVDLFSWAFFMHLSAIRFASDSEGCGHFTRARITHGMNRRFTGTNSCFLTT